METTVFFSSGMAARMFQGRLYLRGRSINPDDEQGLDKITGVFEKYAGHPFPLTEIHIDLDYINSQSNKILFRLLFIAEEMEKKNNKVNIYWYLDKEDDLMEEQSQIFSEVLNIPVLLRYREAS